jgi:hypothetical protein
LAPPTLTDAGIDKNLAKRARVAILVVHFLSHAT